MNQGQGGWPMTVFLTPDQEPFFAGTYFPPVDRYGRPGFRTLLERIADLWKRDRAGLRAQAAEVDAVPAREHAVRARPLRGRGGDPQGGRPSSRATSTSAGAASAARPSSRPPRRCPLLLRVHRRFGDAEALRMATRTLEMMARGRHVRPARRRLPPLLGGRALAGAALREDALRQRAARARLPRGATRPRATPFYRAVAAERPRLRPARDDVARGRLLLRDRRRHRGRRGQVLRLDAGGGARGARRRGGGARSSARPTTSRRRGTWKGTASRTCRGPSTTSRRELGLARPERWTRASPRRAPALYEARAAARAARPRRQGPHRLERAHDRRLGRGVPRARRAALPGRGRARGRLPARAPRRPRTAGCCAPARAGKAHLDAYLEDYAYLAAGLLDLYEAGGDASAPARGGAAGRADPSRTSRRRTAASSPPRAATSP